MSSSISSLFKSIASLLWKIIALSAVVGTLAILFAPRTVKPPAPKTIAVPDVPETARPVSEAAPAVSETAHPASEAVQSVPSLDTAPHVLTNSKVFNSFETDADVSAVSTQRSRVIPVAQEVTDGKQALEISFDAVDYPSINFNSGAPYDWSAYGTLVFDLKNPGTEPVEFSIRVDDNGKADHNFKQGGGNIPAHGEQRFIMPLVSIDSKKYAMAQLPPLDKEEGALVGTWGQDPLNLKHITGWQIFLGALKKPVTLVIDNIRLAPPVELNTSGLVDEFGQNAHIADWPGKVHSVADLARARTAEEADLRAHPLAFKGDKYGGWSAGPLLKATGFFRTQKIGKKWALVDPEGRLFFSLGLDCLNQGSDSTIGKREEMFTWMPASNDPLAKYGGVWPDRGRYFNFYPANLERKYGQDPTAHWRELTMRRLPSWGFNTIGNWADADFCRLGRIPYVVAGGIGGAHAQIPRGEGSLFDPYDPAFAENAEKSLGPQADQLRSDPFCLGYFVDNEIGWSSGTDLRGHYALSYGAMSLDAGSSPGKRRFLELLRKKYTVITALNTAWKTSFANWGALNGPVTLPDAPSPGMEADLSAFLSDHARQYFTVVRDTLRHHDPNHLYLGCRFDPAKTPEALAAAALICDVISFNIYKEGVGAGWESLVPLNKPCIVGEFHFGAQDRGMFGTGMFGASSQADRAAKFSAYVNSALDHPSFVGCHWFEYIDQPLTGRLGGFENYNIGFVTETDTPYPEMIRAARETSAAMYSRRFGAK
jgi:hypothetical protein